MKEYRNKNYIWSVLKLKKKSLNKIARQRHGKRIKTGGRQSISTQANKK